MRFPEHGFGWVITDVGERKLLDIGVHMVWRPLGRAGRAKIGASASPSCGHSPAHFSTPISHFPAFVRKRMKTATSIETESKRSPVTLGSGI